MNSTVKRATLGDVAKAAGLSPAAVSRYLNRSLPLPQATAARIDAVVAALDYRPNRSARSLSRGRSDMIGLVIPDIANPFFGRLAAMVEREANARGLTVMLCTTANSLAREKRYVETLGPDTVDGVLFATNRADPDGSLAAAINGNNTVLVDEDVPGTEVSKVFCDNVAGGFLAGRHLAEAGHRAIAYVGGPAALMSAEERARGLRMAAREAGPAVAIRAELFGDYEVAHGSAAMARILDEHPDVTAVFAGSDEILVGMARLLADRGLAVGEDISVVTFDDAGLLDLMAVPVTAIRQPIGEIAARALHLLTATIEGPTVPSVERLPVELVRRRSVAYRN